MINPVDRPKYYINWLFLDEPFNYKQNNDCGIGLVKEVTPTPSLNGQKMLAMPLLQNKADIFTLQTKWCETEFAHKKFYMLLGKVR